MFIQHISKCFLICSVIVSPIVANEILVAKQVRIYHSGDIHISNDPSLINSTSFDFGSETVGPTGSGQVTIDGDGKFDLISLYKVPGADIELSLTTHDGWSLGALFDTAEEAKVLFEDGTPIDTLIDIHFRKGPGFNGPFLVAPSTVVAYRITGTNIYGAMELWSDYNGEFRWDPPNKNLTINYKQGVAAGDVQSIESQDLFQNKFHFDSQTGLLRLKDISLKSVQVFNLQGDQLSSRNSLGPQTDHTLPGFEALKAGLYTVQIETTNGKLKSFRFIKEQ